MHDDTEKRAIAAIAWDLSKQCNQHLVKAGLNNWAVFRDLVSSGAWALQDENIVTNTCSRSHSSANPSLVTINSLSSAAMVSGISGMISV
jgi:hypothetical protein